MKKALLFFICIAFVGSAVAAPKGPGKPWRPSFKATSVTSFKSPSRVDIITEQPEGTVVNYTRAGEYLFVSLYGYDTDVQAGRVKVVYADDGKTVYIKDPLCYGEGVGAWVIGELSEGWLVGNDRVGVNMDGTGRCRARHSRQPRGG